jgi:hypothetical protein
MATTLMRLALWTAILVLSLYVLAITFEDGPIAAYIPMWLLGQGLVLAGALAVASVVARVLGRGAKVVTQNRCRVCRTPIVSGALYCREHLRSILYEEDDKLHKTREIRRPPGV